MRSSAPVKLIAVFGWPWSAAGSKIYSYEVENGEILDLGRSETMKNSPIFQKNPQQNTVPKFESQKR